MRLVRKIAKREIIRELNEVILRVSYLRKQAEGNLKSAAESQLQWGLKQRIKAYRLSEKILRGRVSDLICDKADFYYEEKYGNEYKMYENQD